MRGSKLTEHVHKFGNTQLDIADGEAAEALEALRTLIDDADCAGQGKNVEGNHITIRYGLDSDEHAGIADYFARCSPFEVTLGKVEMFPPSKHSDNAAVLKVPVFSDELHKMNDELAQQGSFIEPTFDYNPHATVAYVKPEAAFKYVGLPLAHGKRLSATGATISKRDGTSLFVKFEGQPQPMDTACPMGGGYGTLSGQAFGETQNSLELGPQGEPLFRFNDNHDEKGQFTGSGSSNEKDSEWKSSGTKVSGDVKTTTYTGKNQTIVVEHNTKENKITVKHLDANGNLLVQQTHDSVGAARKELTTQGIDHKFYALRSEQRFNDNHDEKGQFTSGDGSGAADKAEPTHERLASEIEAWMKSSSARAAEAAAAVRAGSPDTLVTGIRSSKIDEAAFRGMFVRETGSADNPLSWKEGDSVQIMPSSFSTDQKVAQSFSTGESQQKFGDKAYTQVMLKVEGGMRGLSVDKYSSWNKISGVSVEGNPYASLGTESEVISGGKFSVVSIHDSAGNKLSSPINDEQKTRIYNSLRTITLRQTGVF